MESLENQFISDDYVELLHVATPLSSGELKIVYDGIGNAASIAIGLSGAGLSVYGPLTAGNIIYPTANTPTSLLNFFFPVNSIQFTAININPGVSMGGIWNRIAEGKFIVSVGTGTDSIGITSAFNAGNNRGEYAHTLTVAEMPAHSHPVTLVQSSVGDDNAPGNNFGTSNRLVRPNGGTALSVRLENTGGGRSHNNVPPSFGLYCWQRIA